MEIISSLASFSDVTSVLRGLIVPDLPVVLYCPSEALWPLPELPRLLPLASKLIIDSDSMENSPSALTYLQSLPQTTDLRKADLVWSRLTPWRESIAQIFEDPARLRSVYDLEEIQILYHSPHGEPSSVYYLAGWFMSVLGAGVKIRIAPGVGPDNACIAHVLLTGPKMKAAVDLTSRRQCGSVDQRRASASDGFPACRRRRSVAAGTRDRRAATPRFEDALGLGQVDVRRSMTPDLQHLRRCDGCRRSLRRSHTATYCNPPWSAAACVTCDLRRIDAEADVRGDGEGRLRLETRASVLGG